LLIIYLFAIITKKIDLNYIMQVVTSGKGMAVGESLTAYVDDKLKQELNKYIDRITDANVVFDKQRSNISCHITVLMGTQHGLRLRSNAEAGDSYAVFDLACEKMAKQVRRYKRRIQNHQSEPVREVLKQSVTEYVVEEERSQGELPEVHNPAVIAENQHDLPNISVSEAVMRLDLEHANIYIFKNSRSDKIGVVYRRNDGNIGWVDVS
jgi:ribosomal subunit interface protein